jgi:hypothetical protein
MKRIFFIICVIFILVNCAFAKYSGGDGSEGNPFQISTPNDLNDISNQPEDFNECFILVNDINMAGYAYSTAVIAPTTSTGPIIFFDGIPFNGVFDGNDQGVYNLTINAKGTNNSFLGLFGQIDGGEVKSLGIEGVNIIGGDFSDSVGGLAGETIDANLTDCYVTGNVMGSNRTGGLVGSNQGNIMNCYTEVSVTSIDAGPDPYSTGGVAGMSHGKKMTNSYATGKVSGVSSVGGLIGMSAMDNITDCYATGNVDGNDLTGGLVGNDGTIFGGANIFGCYATGNVSGSIYIGGLVGGGDHTTMINCYANGTIQGEIRTGGLAGSTSSAIIENCYSVSQVIGDLETGGLLGEDNGGTSYTSCFWDADLNPDVNGIGNSSDSNVIGKTTEEMKEQGTFTGWDFVEVWGIGEGQTYPYLREYPGYDLDHNKRTDVNDLIIMIGNWLKEN